MAFSFPRNRQQPLTRHEQLVARAEETFYYVLCKPPYSSTLDRTWFVMEEKRLLLLSTCSRFTFFTAESVLV